MLRLVTNVFRKSRTDATKRPLYSNNYSYLGLSTAFQPSPLHTRDGSCPRLSRAGNSQQLEPDWHRAASPPSGTHHLE